MNLDEAQRAKVAEWISEGLKLSEIQNRIGTELGVRLTYMEVRLLVDDLKLTPKDAEPLPVSPLTADANPPPSARGNKKQPAAGRADRKQPTPAAAAEPPQAGVLVTVDQLARPGALVSGKVTFSDGVSADWQLDQTGRLGLIPKQPGYRPSAEDVSDFQAALETELSKLGF